MYAYISMFIYIYTWICRHIITNIYVSYTQIHAEIRQLHLSGRVLNKYIYVDLYIYTNIHRYLYICKYIYIYIYIYTNIYKYKYKYVCMYV
jgi:hypothetical protein